MAAEQLSNGAAPGQQAPPVPLTRGQMLRVACVKGLPFVAFGFLDNGGLTALCRMSCRHPGVDMGWRSRAVAPAGGRHGLAQWCVVPAGGQHGGWDQQGPALWAWPAAAGQGRPSHGQGLWARPAAVRTGGCCGQGRPSHGQLLRPRPPGSRPTRVTATTPACRAAVIMITAGEQIDIMFGAKLGLSSMAAAGLGNTIADVVGINISHSIEVGGGGGGGARGGRGKGCGRPYPRVGCRGGGSRGNRAGAVVVAWCWGCNTLCHAAQHGGGARAWQPATPRRTPADWRALWRQLPGTSARPAAALASLACSNGSSGCPGSPARCHQRSWRCRKPSVSGCAWGRRPRWAPAACISPWACPPCTACGCNFRAPCTR